MSIVSVTSALKGEIAVGQHVTRIDQRSVFGNRSCVIESSRTRIGHRPAKRRRNEIAIVISRGHFNGVNPVESWSA